jgi:hypothetical protein
MPRDKQTDSLFQRVWMTFGTAPRAALVFATIAGFAVAAVDLILWFTGTKQLIATSIGIGVSVTVVIVAQYAISMIMAERELSVPSLARYALTGVALFLPAALAFGSAWMLPDLIGKPVSGPIFLCLLLIGLAFILLLPAWPVSQAASSRIVSPWRVFRAARGQWWSFLLLASVTGSLSKWVPPLSTARDAPNAAMLAALHGAVNVALDLVFASIAVSSWQLACRRDSDLIGDAPQR